MLGNYGNFMSLKTTETQDFKKHLSNTISHSATGKVDLGGMASEIECYICHNS
jgi:hypothetical protein